MKSTTQKTNELTHKLKSVLLLFLAVAGLYYAQAFLKPICFAMLLAMLLLPMTNWMENRSINTYVASFISTLVVVIVIGLVSGLLWWQISGIAENTANIEQTFNEWMRLAQRFMYRTFGLNYTEQKEMLDEQQSALTSYIPNIMKETTATLAKVILVLVYSFLFLTHRDKIQRFVLRVSENSNEENTKSMITSVNELSISYLGGLLKLIVAMTTLYSLGYWIIGINNPIFFGAICGSLEMIPFLGNIIGTLVTAIGAIAQDGNEGILPLIFVVYLVAQFIQSYILEPLIIGKEVNVNPMFSILALILGELLWGIPGMVLAIPMLGILKIYFDHTKNLKPYGQLIGADKQEGSGLITKVKDWFKRKTDTD